MEFTDRHLKGLIGREPDVGIAMLAELARRLRTLTEKYADLVRQHPSDGSESPGIDGAIGDEAVLGPIEYALRDDERHR